MGRSKDAIKRIYMTPQFFPCRNIWAGCSAKNSFATTVGRDQHEGPCIKAAKRDSATRADVS